MVVVVRGTDQVSRDNQQNQPKDIERPGKGVDQGHTKENEAGAGDQRKNNAKEQNLLMVGPRHLEAGNNEQEDKEVIEG